MAVATVIGPAVAEEPSADGPLPRHSSDGVAGPVAGPIEGGRAPRAVVARERSYRIGPGLRFRQWDQTDARGPIRAHLLTANLGRKGLTVDYAGLSAVVERDRLRRIVKADGAVAGVNGDFFDIADTGAPLGVGVRRGKVLHGPRNGWNLSFTIGEDGRARIGRRPVEARVQRVPEVAVTNVNSPYVPPHGVGLYTRAWGDAPGYAVTDGARRREVRQVVVSRGRVVSNTRRVTTGVPVEGRVLIGRDRGARAMKRHLPVGSRARIRVGADKEPVVAISGNERLLRRGRVVARDDTELHPRTAVGIDTDTGKVLLLVVDGRQDHSRGYTMFELAKLLRRQGAEEALNLDGGGSSTMVTTRPSGRLRVANSPSSGEQRPVPNGLELRYE